MYYLERATVCGVLGGDSIDLEDTLAAIRDIRSGHVLRPPEWIQAMETLKRYVRHAITLARVEDYQLALESESPTVNLLAPDLTCPNIDTLPLLTPIPYLSPGSSIQTGRVRDVSCG